MRLTNCPSLSLSLRDLESQIVKIIVGALHARSNEGNEGRADTTAILGNANTDFLSTLGADAVDDGKSLVDHVAEERIVLDQATVDSNVNDLLVGVVDLVRLDGNGANGDCC